MNRSNRLLVISVILLGLAVVTFWQGLNDVQERIPKQQQIVPSPVPEEASEAGTIQTDNAPSSGQVVRVMKVIDGDTIEVSIGGENKKVRLIGIDTPETVDPRRSVGCFGKEASNETHRLLDNQSVVLVKDVSEADKYDRLLRYVYLVKSDDNWLFVNDYLVRSGFAKSYTYPPDVAHQAEFVEAEAAAREAKLGLWGSKCNGNP